MKIDRKYLTGILIGIVLVLVVNLVAKTFFLDDNGMKKLSEIKSIVDKNFTGEIDDERLKDFMYTGYMAGLNDRYSYYMDKDTFDSFLRDSEGTYVGIGLTGLFDTDVNKIVVTDIIKNGSAEKVGIKKDDQITAVDGVSINNSNYNEMFQKIRGKEGTTVKLTIFRPSENKTFEVEATRENISVPTVESQFLDDKIGYIKISEFDGVTYDQYMTALNDLKNKGMERLIIDLRDNPGGLLKTVVQITDTLVPKGTITYIEDKNGNKSYEYSDDDYLNIPLVIMVNGNSASASEVLSGAVKDFGVGKLVGEKTFGKGVVQNTFRLSDGSGIKVTIAKYYTPKGICIHGKGIQPDYEVKTADAKTSPTSMQDDTQLQKGIEILKSMK